MYFKHNVWMCLQPKQFSWYSRIKDQPSISVSLLGSLFCLYQWSLKSHSAITSKSSCQITYEFIPCPLPHPTSLPPTLPHNFNWSNYHPWDETPIQSSLICRLSFYQFLSSALLVASEENDAFGSTLNSY